MANTHSNSPVASYCLKEQLEKQREVKKFKKTTEKTKGLGGAQRTSVSANAELKAEHGGTGKETQHKLHDEAPQKL